MWNRELGVLYSGTNVEMHFFFRAFLFKFSMVTVLFSFYLPFLLVKYSAAHLQVNFADLTVNWSLYSPCCRLRCHCVESCLPITLTCFICGLRGQSMSARAKSWHANAK